MTTHHFKVTAPRTRKRLKKIAQVFCRMLVLSVLLSVAPLVIWLRADDSPPPGPGALSAVSDAILTNAFVWTDQGDYPPGSTAQIFGRNFQPGENVTLQVVHADGTPDSGADHEPWTIAVADDGTFASTWHVCEDD